MLQRSTIAFCLEYPIALRGGVSVLVEHLALHFAKTYDLVLVSSDSREAFEATPLAAAGVSHLPWAPRQTGCRAARSLARNLKERGVQLAHFHSGGFYGWGNRFPGQSAIYHTARRGVTCLHTTHQAPANLLEGYCGPQKPTAFKLALLPVAWLSRALDLGVLHTEITVSRHNGDRIGQWYFPFRNRVRTVYHSRLPTVPAPSPPSREKWIVALGHLAFRKGQHCLVEAFAPLAHRHPGWKLLLIGPPVEEACHLRILEIIRRSGLEAQVELPGSRDDASEFLRRASVFVQPSLLEALGLALQEALFEGCACIGSDTGGIPEQIVHGENGLLVPPGDVAALTTALEQLISNEPLRLKLGRTARERALQSGINASSMVSEYHQLYTSILTHG